MIRDLYNVRPLAPEPGRTPLTPDEERRTRATLFTELGNAIADHNWTRFPAHTPRERQRLVAVGHMLSAHWGIPVTVEAEDECRMRLSLPGHELHRAVTATTR
ncbi:hypothetical protein [Streptomyces sp. NP-1717]|uniref:hypothetical protein n=1 Tax=unclassified Streptomyces TaxID=2593676 RepID=UPI001F5E0233|nr:hypothetical protein [Streptomyces sp. NP-1717]MCI3222944.1 hypothetical protein [Streptomyces sp. NP-1717]WTA75458.1 hypothetical protein OG705_22680 [Streptomyces sp. NBC_00838]